MNWKVIEIDGIKTNYAVSDEGLVKNIKRNKMLSLSEQQGYMHTTLSINRKARRFRVHRLVALMFIPNDNALRNIVNHKNGIRNDNRVENLEWLTQKENTQHAWDTGLATSVVRRKISQFTLKGEFVKNYDSIVSAVKETSSIDSKITLCCQRSRISHNGFYWRYFGDDKDIVKTNENYVPPTKPKSVNQYSLDGTFIASYRTTGEAARAVKGTQSAVSRCCNGKNNFHKGFVWKFLDEDIVHD